jgi:hypothetical protein
MAVNKTALRYLELPTDIDGAPFVEPTQTRNKHP